MITDYDLLNEIETKRDKVIEKPDHFLSYRRRQQKSLEEDAKAHSLCLEEPNLVKEAKYINNSEAEADIEKLETNLDKAWDYAKEEVNGSLETEDIIIINKLVRFGSQPDLDNPLDTYFRHENVRVPDEGVNQVYLRPDYNKVPKEILEMIDELESWHHEGEVKELVERSNRAHLALAYIHPFEDGNGRTARIVQNAMLHNQEMPPARVPAH